YALGGAIGQAVGLVLSKYGMSDYNAFGATQIRVITGMIGFAVIFLILKRFPLLTKVVRNRNAMKYTTIGAFIGPFLGVSLSLYAVQHTITGIASTIMAIVPVLIIPLEVLIKKEKITFREVAGAIIAVSGVALYFIE
ncbi:MAG TPA: DMT family transporter, partial [Candidatus Marinimicrobia bacterium]|nr:DMT family transporter [Candidatus Neomarinimicrobiota bacterium]HQE95670.1 DMT family transporter [Candidatus Neomarinimicrobiota bacterium]HQH57084.1 DMT family transporter [Candidatus Neomarinimicrobiota bacterium]